jgi:hypothetical protein
MVIEKQPSPSIKPVINQGLSAGNEVEVWINFA